MNNNIQTIREACIAANSGIMKRSYNDEMRSYEEDDIRLADVLLAIEKHIRERFETQSNADLLSNFQEGLWSVTRELIKKWNLRATLEDQSPECLEFLASLLDNK